MSIGRLTDSDLNAIYKTQYHQLMQNIFATYGDLWGMIRKTYGKGGDEVKSAIQNTFGGGVGSSSDGTLPNANMEKYLEPTFTWNRVYANIQLDGLTIEAARKSEHAFVNVADKATLHKMQSFQRYLSGNCLFGDGTGALGQFSGNATGTATAPILTILNTTGSTYQYRQGYFEVGDDVNINTLSSVFRITAVNHTSFTVTLSRISGSDDLTAIGAGTHTVYMQNSKDNDPYGLLGIIQGSTHYGVAEEYRYAPHEIAAGGAELENEMLVELVEDFHTNTDKYPNLVMLPPLHYKRFLSLQEDLKSNPVRLSRKPGKSNIGSEKALAKVSYNGMALAAGDGDIMVVKNKFIKPGHAYAVHTDHLEVLGVGEKPGFQNRIDGQTFLRLEGKDAYGAFLRFYGEIFINPFYVGAITGLPTS
jgi:hypothetical protein